MMKEWILLAFKNKFGFLQEKIEIMDLLGNNSKMNYEAIDLLKLPTDSNNIVWHPGVYVFIGDNSVYRVGVSMNNSRARVMQHLKHRTSKNGYCIWDIDQYEDKLILLFNVEYKTDGH